MTGPQMTLSFQPCQKRLSTTRKIPLVKKPAHDASLPTNLAWKDRDKRTQFLCCKGACVFRFETLWWLEVTVILSWAVPLQKLDNPRCERKKSSKMTVRTGSPKRKLWYCWWLKSGVHHHLRLVVCPMIYRVYKNPRWLCRDFSTGWIAKDVAWGMVCLRITNRGQYMNNIAVESQEGWSIAMRVDRFLCGFLCWNLDWTSWLSWVGSWLLRDCRDTKDPIYIVSGCKIGVLGTTCGEKTMSNSRKVLVSSFSVRLSGPGRMRFGGFASINYVVVSNIF